jgi:hypothetical protein
MMAAIEIDNNAAELALRAATLRRKNSHDRRRIKYEGCLSSVLNCVYRPPDLRHQAEHTGYIRRLLKLSIGRRVTQGNDS